MSTVRLHTQCHCRKQTYHVDVPESAFPLENWMCHCNDCRRITGLLSSDYVILPRGVKGPFQVDKVPKGLRGYKKKNGRITWYFCEACGAHLLQSEGQPGQEIRWDFSQGTMYPLLQKDEKRTAVRTKHMYVNHGRDLGGATQYIADGVTRYNDDGKTEASAENDKPTAEEAKRIEEIKAASSLPIRCHCGHVQITAHRPAVRPVDSKWKERIKGKEGNAWGWNYCMCHSCRTTSGFDSSCFFYLPYTHLDGPAGSKHPTDGLTLYTSNPDVRRYFCPTCGASVFYESINRGALADVFMGLIDAPLAGVFNSWVFKDSQPSYFFDARDKEFADSLAKGYCPGRVIEPETDSTSSYDGALHI